MLDNFLNDAKTWAAKPYDDNMNAFHWLLFIGFVGALTYLWSTVLKRILNS